MLFLIIYSPGVDLYVEFELYSDNDGSGATVVMVRLVLSTVRFFVHTGGALTAELLPHQIS